MLAAARLSVLLTACGHEGTRMHIDHNSWLGVFKEQEELAAQQPPDDPAPPVEPGAAPTPRLRLVPPPATDDS